MKNHAIHPNLDDAEDEAPEGASDYDTVGSILLALGRDVCSRLDDIDTTLANGLSR